MDVRIRINCDNAAFDGVGCGPELARILRVIAAEVDGFNKVGAADAIDGLKLHDTNGNTVGKVEVSE
jgi:hypothetical protein